MKISKGAVLLAGASLALTMTATMPAAQAAPSARHAKSPAPPVITLQVNSVDNTKIDISRANVRPGVVEFRRTGHATDEIDVVRTDKFGEAVGLIGTMFNPTTTPEDAAVAAAKFQKIVTMEGGGQKGTRWQVRLKAGTYYAIDVDSNAVGTFTVKGKKRKGSLHSYDSWIHTVLPNRFETSKKPHGGWLQFRNDAKEIHFVNADGVKKGTTNRDVRKAFNDPNSNPTFTNKKHFQLGSISPGVDARYRIKIDKSKYLLDCFWISKTDGMPHALMGMWKLVDFVKQ